MIFFSYVSEGRTSYSCIEETTHYVSKTQSSLIVKIDGRPYDVGILQFIFHEYIGPLFFHQIHLTFTINMFY